MYKCISAGFTEFNKLSVYMYVYSSVGRACAQYTAAISPLQRLLVQLLSVAHLLCVIPSLYLLSYHIFSCHCQI